jgi:hypothetical protein
MFPREEIQMEAHLLVHVLLERAALEESNQTLKCLP